MENAIENKEKELQKQLQDNIKDKLNDIPDKILKSFTKRSIRDAEKVIDINNDKFSDIAYAIFRGYCIGFVMGTIDKISK